MATYILTAKSNMYIDNQRIDRNRSFTVSIPDSITQSYLFSNPQSRSIIGNCIAMQSGMGIPSSKIPLGNGYWDVKKL